ncbi:MAG: PEP-CTERM sorting domain-containing protein [Deltaproteobacteria bacterium]|nr:PEP-CTERM sorting domain-containing protein [Deltaproteobacteria bacterium]
MKRILGVLLGLGLLVMPVMSQALSLDQVGGVDNLLAFALLPNSGDQTEINWVNGILGTAFTTADYDKETTTTTDWTKIDNTTTIYFNNVADVRPEYFLIKVGAGNKDPQYDTFLYENIGDLDYAVINLTGLTYEDVTINIKNIGKVSHLGTFDSAPVPEPATMLLLGSGLVGLAGFRKRFKK